MLSKPAATASWSPHRINRRECLSTRAAIVAGSFATLVLWLGITEAMLQWM